MDLQRAKRLPIHPDGMFYAFTNRRLKRYRRSLKTIDLELAIGSPAKELKRARLIREELCIPTNEQFHQLVEALRNRKHIATHGDTNTSMAGADGSADYIELLA